eukprot:GHVP01034383.1.p1 GENE.GHVP01034383.1~~GHVP01034383.1.p1  ORF type:complete len:317 (-),score=21.66 GHVP01034383.1:389-1339(-)
MMDEITTMLALLCLFQAQKMTEVQEIIYQGLSNKKIPEQQAAPSIWFTSYFVEFDPSDMFAGLPNPIQPASYPYPEENEQPSQIDNEEFSSLNPELDQPDETIDTTTLPYSDPAHFQYPQEKQTDTTQPTEDYTLYPFQNHIYVLSQPLKTHQLTTTITKHNPTGASISATCTCTFPSTTSHPHASYRSFATANGKTTLLTLHTTWHFPQIPLQIPNVLAAIIPCNNHEHTRLIGLNIIHTNPLIQSFIKDSLFNNSLPPLPQHKPTDTTQFPAALLPHIQHLAPANYFTFIDLKDAFHQIPLSTDTPITTPFNDQ